MTVDEEFNKLEDDLRRLKVEYEVYFNGAAPRPPHDTLFRVEYVIKKYSSDQSKLNMSQRFRFSSLAQKYAINMTLWRRKLQEKEEGRTLGAPQKRTSKVTDLPPLPGPVRPVRVICADPDTESDRVNELLEAMRLARAQVGESADGIDSARFHKFVKDKTQQIKDRLGCKKVQFSVSIEDGKVKFKAAKAE